MEFKYILTKFYHFDLFVVKAMNCYDKFKT